MLPASVRSASAALDVIHNAAASAQTVLAFTISLLAKRGHLIAPLALELRLPLSSAIRPPSALAMSRLLDHVKIAMSLDLTYETLKRQRLGDTEDDTYRASWISARFVRPEVEEAFLKSRTDGMKKGVFLAYMILGVTCLVYQLQLELSGATTTVEKLIVRLVVGIVAIAIALASRVPFLDKLLGFRFYEFLLIVCYIAFLAVSLAEVDKWRDTYQKHAELSENGTRYTQVVSLWQAKLALTLDTVVTITHLLLPVRWSVIIWADILYAVGFALHDHTFKHGTYEDGAPVEVVVYTLAALILGASVGLRIQEQANRKLFALVIDERTQRVAADFQRESSVRKRLSGASSPGTLTSAPPSEAARTTDTAGIFEQLKVAESSDTLAVLENMGVNEHWFIDPSELTMPFPPKVLGRGGFGLVVEASFCHTTVAVKMFEAPLDDDVTIDRTCINELRFLRHLRHPNIVSFIGASFGAHGNAPRIILEKVVGKPLKTYLQHCNASCSSKPESQHLLNLEATNCAKTVMQGVIRALVYLHSRKPPVVHSDLKPSNIIVVENLAMEPLPKLLDFGVTRAVTQHAVVGGGTDKVMAPEIDL